MAATKYPISTSTDEFTRLRVQADLFRNDARAMLMQIGDGAGLRVLDLCCGTGGITDNGLGILDHMLTLVRPAGVVFVE
jgi:ubiquinone/menaquinone biosynthesis C-methylase UbiE